MMKFELVLEQLSIKELKWLYKLSYKSNQFSADQYHEIGDVLQRKMDKHTFEEFDKKFKTKLGVNL